MFKMPYSRKYHGHVMFITIFNRILIPDRASRLDNGRDSFFMRDLHTIRRKEKRHRKP